MYGYSFRTNRPRLYGYIAPLAAWQSPHNSNYFNLDALRDSNQIRLKDTIGEEAECKIRYHFGLYSTTHWYPT